MNDILGTQSGAIGGRDCAILATIPTQHRARTRVIVKARRVTINDPGIRVRLSEKVDDLHASQSSLGSGTAR